MNKKIVVYRLPQAFGLRNDEGGKGWYSQTRHCESCLQLVAISVWCTIIHSWNSFLFCFCVGFLWFMDCFVVSLLAMTVPPRRHCEALKSPWQSQYGDQHTKPTIVIARVACNSWQSQYGV